jgi:hypothetical protein
MLIFYQLRNYFLSTACIQGAKANENGLADHRLRNTGTSTDLTTKPKEVLWIQWSECLV